MLFMTLNWLHLQFKISHLFHIKISIFSVLHLDKFDFNILHLKNNILFNRIKLIYKIEITKNSYICLYITTYIGLKVESRKCL